MAKKPSPAPAKPAPALLRQMSKLAAKPAPQPPATRKGAPRGKKG